VVVEITVSGRPFQIEIILFVKLYFLVS